MTFDSGFEVASVTPRDLHRQKVVAEASSRRSIPTAFDRNGKPTAWDMAENCNQEPTTVEIYRFLKRGCRDGWHAHEEAKNYRLLLNGNSTPIPPTIAGLAAGQAYDEVWPPCTKSKEELMRELRSIGSVGAKA